MIWIVFAFIPVLIDAWANIVDGHFSNHSFRDVWVLLFYLGVIEIVFSPLLLLYAYPTILPLGSIALLGVVTILDFVCLGLYFKALQRTDTSIVAALFSLGKIFVPLLAFFLLDERLSLHQYVGFLIIIICSTILTTRWKRGTLKINASFVLMGLSSLGFSLQGVLYKLALEQVHWTDGFFYTTFFSVPIFIGIFWWKHTSIQSHWRAFRRSWRLMTLESGLGFVSHLAGTLAFALAPVTLIKGIYATQSLVVLAYTPLIARWTHWKLHEDISRDSVHKKVICFILIILSVILIIR